MRSRENPAGEQHERSELLRKRSELIDQLNAYTEEYLKLVDKELKRNKPSGKKGRHFGSVAPGSHEFDERDSRAAMDEAGIRHRSHRDPDEVANTDLLHDISEKEDLLKEEIMNLNLQLGLPQFTWDRDLPETESK